MKEISYRNRRFFFVIASGLLLLLLLCMIGLRLGAVRTPFSQIAEEFLQGEGLVFDYRLPRVLVSMLVGINMALSGSILQGLTRNPLAAPDIIGVTAGGGLAAVTMLLAVPHFSPPMLPFAAFGGAVAAGVLVYVLAYKDGMRPARLALCGVAVSSGIQALITLLIVKYAPSAAQALVWLKGSLYARTWEHVQILWPWTLSGTMFALLSFRQLNLLQLTEESIRGLGMNIERVRILLLIIAIGLAGSAVAVAGTIGFVGLVIPHLTRILVGSDFRRLLPASALLGAILVLAADTAGRSIIPPFEIPTGIITSLIGAPYFIYLLVKRTI